MRAPAAEFEQLTIDLAQPREYRLDVIDALHPHRAAEPLPAMPTGSRWDDVETICFHDALRDLSGSARLLVNLTMLEVAFELLDRVYDDRSDAGEVARADGWNVIHAAHAFCDGAIGATELFKAMDRLKRRLASLGQAAYHDEHSASRVYACAAHLFNARVLSWTASAFSTHATRWVLDLGPGVGVVTRGARHVKRAALVREWWQRWQCRMALATAKRWRFERLSWRVALEDTHGTTVRFDALLTVVDWAFDDVTDELVESRVASVRTSAVERARRHADLTWCARMERLAAADRSARVRTAAETWLRAHCKPTPA